MDDGQRLVVVLQFLKGIARIPTHFFLATAYQLFGLPTLLSMVLLHMACLLASTPVPLAAAIFTLAAE